MKGGFLASGEVKISRQELAELDPGIQTGALPMITLLPPMILSDEEAEGLAGDNDEIAA